MSTPNPLDLPTLQQIHSHLLEIDPTLHPHSKHPHTLPAERLALDNINAELKRANTAFEQQARALYQGLEQEDLTQPAGQQRLSRLNTQLIPQLQRLDETSTVQGQSRQTYLAYAAGIRALEQETRLNVSDALLTPADQLMLEDCSRGPDFRPGMYALTFSYQEQTVVFAGCFVLTREATPTVDTLDASAAAGRVLLFSPNRGLEAFSSLSDLDQGLRSVLATRAGRAEFNRHLPMRYQHLNAVDMFALELQRIEAEPLFERVYQTLLDKREHDINLALSLAHNAQLNAVQLKERLDNAIRAALPDLTLRLDFRAQQLLARDLFSTLPAWYRGASDAQRETLNQVLLSYNSARRAFISVFGAAATPQALARHQWAEQLADELDIHDLDPQLLHITTRRTVASVGTYAQQRSLVDLSLRGLHPGDSTPGSAFLEHSSVTYAGAPLDAAYAHLTPQTLLTLLQDLQPRLDFAHTQKTALATPQIKHAARAFLDQRLVAMTCLAKLQGHLSAADVQRFDDLREHPRPSLCAQTVLLHGAQLKDLWLLRENTADGQVNRLLLCTPDAPGDRQFFAFNTLRACQTHIIGWADNQAASKGRTFSDYLLEQVPLRFKPKMGDFLKGIRLHPAAAEHLEVTFGKPCSYLDCLDAMAGHLLVGQLDDYDFGSPAWYRAASASDRMRLAKFADDAAGALRMYNDRPDSEANFPTFDRYLHAHAKTQINRLLGRAQEDIDPDSVYAHPPKSLIGAVPKPVSYTTLYRDGYTDGVGFLDEKFSAAATFSGPPEVDLSPLTPQKVARSVTGVWIGQRYTDEVRRRLQNSSSPGYDARRNAVLALQQLPMKTAALESRLKGHIASADLAWLERAIDSLPSTDSAMRGTYKVHRVSIDGDWVVGNYLFSHGNNPVLLYTPEAPDGIGFREARLFNYLLKKVEGMPDYWRKRVPLKSATRVGLFLENASKGLPDTIDRTTPSPARYDSTHAMTPLTDLRHEFYNMSLQRKIDDVQAATVNRTQMISGILWTCVEWVTAVATMPFPILSLTLGGALAFKEAMLALDAYHQRDKSAVLTHFVGYLANIGGALLFDLRPVLTKTFNALRPVIRAGAQAADNPLLSQINTLKPEGMRPVLYDGQSRWVKQAPDALGRYLLYRQHPLTGEFQSTARWVNQNADGLWVRSGVVGGGRKKYETLLADESSALEAFDVAPEQATTFRTLLDPQFSQRMQNMEPGFSGAAQVNAISETVPLRTAYARKVDDLTRQADAFFQVLPAPAPKAPPPTLATDASHGEILSTLFNRDKRLIIGAADNSIASKQLLIEQLPGLAEQGLKRVYIENLPRDLFHRKLKVLNNQLAGNKAHALAQIERHLTQVDEALGFAPDAPFTYRKLLLETQRLSIRIDGLDAAVSYHMDPILALGDGARFIPRSSKVRNFYSHMAIEQNLKQHPEEGWLALVEPSRLGTYERVAGLADLQNSLALRIEDAAPGQPTGLWLDTASAAQSRGDYRLAMPTAHAALQARGAAAQPASAATHFAEFDVPYSQRKDMDDLRMTHRGMDTGYIHFNPRYAAAQHTFSTIRTRLRNTAQAFFADFTLAQRGALTELAAATSEQDFIRRVYLQKLGLVIGEAHAEQSSKRLLIDQMKHLKKQGVKTLYMEHLLTDLHQEALDTYQRTLKMPAILENYLGTLDRGHMLGYTGSDTFTHVVKAANKYGIRVRALDCTASYYVKNFGSPDTRGQLFSYFANAVINADQRALGPHKWVAFTGSAHTDMYLGVPGLTQLQDAVSLHVRDTAPELARPLHRGAWESVDEGKGTALRSDFKIEVGIKGRRVNPQAPLPDRSRLTQPGQFIIERPSATEINLVHVSRSNEVVTTPIQINDQGQHFIERWDLLKDQRFYYLHQLIEALKGNPPLGIGLRPAS